MTFITAWLYQICLNIWNMHPEIQVCFLLMLKKYSRTWLQSLKITFFPSLRFPWKSWNINYLLLRVRSLSRPQNTLITWSLLIMKGQPLKVSTFYGLNYEKTISINDPYRPRIYSHLENPCFMAVFPRIQHFS